MKSNYLSVYEAVQNERKKIAKRLCDKLDAEEISAATGLKIYEINKLIEEKQADFFQWLCDNLPEENA
ncbi:hypothetical protein [Bacillus sp. CGMCC 1.16541]|uniref:hypothetical protein n=1 Tax=Bacillus sp. CGMCC 1.16541 TaxID=2185143 RepID=UPI000D72FD42|nr:hypothetical protein [Bacillus sp. CGMCC 1.16541]